MMMGDDDDPVGRVHSEIGVPPPADDSPTSTLTQSHMFKTGDRYSPSNNDANSPVRKNSERSGLSAPELLDAIANSQQQPQPTLVAGTPEPTASRRRIHEGDHEEVDASGGGSGGESDDGSSPRTELRIDLPPKPRRKRYMGMDHSVSATPPRMPMNSSANNTPKATPILTANSSHNGYSVNAQGTPKIDEDGGNSSARRTSPRRSRGGGGGGGGGRKQFNLSNYRQLTKEERRRLLQEVKMVLGEESLLSGMNNEEDVDDVDESLLEDINSQYDAYSQPYSHAYSHADRTYDSRAHTLGSQTNTQYTADEGTMYTMDEGTMYTMDENTQYTTDTRTMYTTDTRTMYTADTGATSFDGEERGRQDRGRGDDRNGSLLADIEEELSEDDEHFFSLTDACFAYLCDGNRQEAEEKAKAKKARKRQERERQERVRRAAGEEVDWNKGGQRYAQRRARQEDEDEGIAEANDDHNRTSSGGLTVKERLNSRLAEAEGRLKEIETARSASLEAVKEEAARNDEGAVPPAEEADVGRDEAAVGETNADDSPRAGDPSSTGAVIPPGNSTRSRSGNRGGIGGGFEKIAEVVTELEADASVGGPRIPLAKCPSLKITVSNHEDDEAVEVEDDDKDDDPEIDEELASPTSLSRGSPSAEKERSGSPMDVTAGDDAAASAKQDPSPRSVEREPSNSSKTSNSTKSAKSSKSGKSEGSARSNKSSRSSKSAKGSDGGAQGKKKKGWREYTDPSTGGKYYSNGTSTTWTRPANVEIVNASRSGTPPTPVASADETTPMPTPVNRNYHSMETPVASNVAAKPSKPSEAEERAVDDERAVDGKQAVEDKPPLVAAQSQRKSKLNLFSKFKKSSKARGSAAAAIADAPANDGDPEGVPRVPVTRWPSRGKGIHRAESASAAAAPNGKEPESPGSSSLKSMRWPSRDKGGGNRADLAAGEIGREPESPGQGSLKSKRWPSREKGGSRDGGDQPESPGQSALKSMRWTSRDKGGGSAEPATNDGGNRPERNQPESPGQSALKSMRWTSRDKGGGSADPAANDGGKRPETLGQSSRKSLRWPSRGKGRAASVPKVRSSDDPKGKDVGKADPASPDRTEASSVASEAPATPLANIVVNDADPALNVSAYNVITRGRESANIWKQHVLSLHANEEIEATPKGIRTSAVENAAGGIQVSAVETAAGGIRASAAETAAEGIQAPAANDAGAESKPRRRRKKKGWREYTDPATGKKYYSDGVTTTWDRPADFAGGSSSDPPVAAAAAGRTSSSPAAAGVASAGVAADKALPHDESQGSSKTEKAKGGRRKKRGWREYTDKNTGMKYYSDGVTTTWDRPANFPASEA